MGILLQIVVFACGGWLLWTLWNAGQPASYFTVRLVNGQPRISKGTVTPAFLRLVREVAEWNNLKDGKIHGVARGSGIGLKFSRSIPEPARQQIRNGWGTMGWKAGPRRSKKV